LVLENLALRHQLMVLDRNGIYGSEFTRRVAGMGIAEKTIAPRSPWQNAHLERWNRSVEDECLSKLVLFGERSLRHVLSNYARHYHEERNHQGKENVILFPTPPDRIGSSTGKIQTRERLVGLLKFHHREVA
jgi:putative transposase